ncbi:MAG TPA: hypothetical protein VKM94_22805 [Blastocatellia bacterium]|nr:hypothetical protein [Blastocatellia bacterium]
MSALSKYFLAAPVPTTAAGFADDNFAVVDMRRGRRQFLLATSAATQLPLGLVSPDFDKPNIADAAQLADIVKRTAEAAALANKKNWSVALPDSAVRTLVVSLESKPSGRSELNEVIEWKIERVLAVPPSQLRIARQRISPAGVSERYLVTTSRDEVISQYESVFESIGWKAGLLLGRHIGEAQWLSWDDTAGDKMLVSANRHGFTALISRNGEPILVRTFVCEPQARGDELHRLALYYRDRLNKGLGATISRMLVLGGFDSGEAYRAVSDALESEPGMVDTTQFGLDLTGEAITFEQIAGAAGLATMAWQ